jgi:hypothetical protein
MNPGRSSRHAISKLLSANDSGETGAHQAGILVPKDSRVLSFFPPLDKSQLNPRHHLIFYDEEDERWEFAFIYYNDVFFGGTRNEYRLTRMTPFIKQNGLRAGDELILERLDGGRRLVRYRRARQATRERDGVLRLGSEWKVIEF